MTGVICGKCGNASNEPRPPKCERNDCPGKETFKPLKRSPLIDAMLAERNK